VENKGEVTIYQSRNGSIEVGVMVEKDSVWLTQKQISKLFNKGRTTVTEHIRNVFKEGELEEKAVCRNFRHTAADGKFYDTVYYNLDVIISVGYRVHSKEGVRFRQWATQVLKMNIINGYTLNKDRLGELENLYRFIKDTLTVTSMNINKLRIDSARQKDLAILADDIEKIKKELDVLKKRS
jgi:hypothetical protein